MSSNVNTILFILPASSVTITFEVVFLVLLFYSLSKTLSRLTNSWGLPLKRFYANKKGATPLRIVAPLFVYFIYERFSIALLIINRQISTANTTYPAIKSTSRISTKSDVLPTEKTIGGIKPNEQAISKNP